MKSVFYHIWKVPLLLTILTLAGLLSALVGTGVWHVFSWVALSIPLLVCIRFTVWQKRQ